MSESSGWRNRKSIWLFTPAVGAERMSTPASSRCFSSGGLDLAGDVALAGLDAADADTVLLGDDDVHRVEGGASGVLPPFPQLRRCPVVVLAGGEGEFGVAFLPR
jgi:hypothetical protein